MKRAFDFSQLIGFAVTIFLGTILHFIYEWCNESRWIAPFSGVNESTWEHMKLLFCPMLIFSVIESFFRRGRSDFWCIKARGIMLGLAAIPILFYTYNGVIGKSPDWVNIGIFFVSAAIAFLYQSVLLKRESTTCFRPWIAIAVLLSIGTMFVVFTFYTPPLAIFKDPLTGAYGIPQ